MPKKKKPEQLKEETIARLKASIEKQEAQRAKEAGGQNRPNIIAIHEKEIARLSQLLKACESQLVIERPKSGLPEPRSVDF